MDAQTLTHFMNRFLSPMTEIITNHKGTIDKYIGDCIMAFWNAPLDDPDHAKNAVRAAQDMRRALIELNRQWEAEAAAAGKTFNPVKIGIGLNTGECVVGNFGSMQRFDYSLLGDPVNLASRLESLGKVYGLDVIIGEETAARLDDHRPDRGRCRRRQGQDASQPHLYDPAGNNRRARSSAATSGIAGRLPAPGMEHGVGLTEQRQSGRVAIPCPGIRSCTSSGSRNSRSSRRRRTGTAYSRFRRNDRAGCEHDAVRAAAFIPRVK